MGPEGFSMEEAFHINSKNGPIKTFKRDLQKIAPGEYWMYTEEYFYPRQCANNFLPFMKLFKHMI